MKNNTNKGQFKSPAQDSTITDINMLIKLRLPKKYHKRFNVPNLPLSVHKEGPLLTDHLQEMLNVLNNPYAYNEIPSYFQNIIAEQKHRLFYEFYILIHDMAKIEIRPQTVVEEGNKFELYPNHESESAALIEKDMEIAKDFEQRDVLVEVVRLHGKFYQIAKEVLDDKTFKTFVEKINESVEKNTVLIFLITCGFIDTIATHRKDKWQPRVDNFASAYKTYQQKNSGKFGTK